MGDVAARGRQTAPDNRRRTATRTHTCSLPQKDLVTLQRQQSNHSGIDGSPWARHPVGLPLGNNHANQSGQICSTISSSIHRCEVRSAQLVILTARVPRPAPVSTSLASACQHTEGLLFDACWNVALRSRCSNPNVDMPNSLRTLSQ